MIDDPISFAGAGVIHDHFKVSSKPLFIVYDDVLIALIRGYGKPLWAITKSHNSDEREYKDSAIGYISREQFIDYVMADFPDHFEWLLFHPEWL